MFAVIDCGTTMTRAYLVKGEDIVAVCRKKVGVRDTSITGSSEVLRCGIEGLLRELMEENGIGEDSLEFVIASGMITSEIGLIEIPHLVAPAGLRELAASVFEVPAGGLLPFRFPIRFIRGIRNDYGDDAGVKQLRSVDFLRGEEVQVMGVLEERPDAVPCAVVALSSHTKIMHLDERGRITASNTTLSGQLFEALSTSTSIGKSIRHAEGEESGGYSWEEIVDTAVDCVENAGLSRTLLMPRFMQVLLKTDSNERILFTDAALAADDMHAFREMHRWGKLGGGVILYGHEERCRLYKYLLHREFGGSFRVESIPGIQAQDRLTVKGTVAVARERAKQQQ